MLNLRQMCACAPVALGTYLESSLSRFKIQDSRFRKNFLNPASPDSRFKIQDSEKTSWIQPLRIQDSRFKIQKKLLESSLSGFKIQEVFFTSIELISVNLSCSAKFNISHDRRVANSNTQRSPRHFNISPAAHLLLHLNISLAGPPKPAPPLILSFISTELIQNSRFRKNFLNPAPPDSRFKIQDSEKTSWIQLLRIQDSRFKIQKKLLESSLSGFKIQDSRFRKNRETLEGTPNPQHLELSYQSHPESLHVQQVARIKNPSPMNWHYWTGKCWW